MLKFLKVTSAPKPIPLGCELPPKPKKRLVIPKKEEPSSDANLFSHRPVLEGGREGGGGVRPFLFSTENSQIVAYSPPTGYSPLFYSRPFLIFLPIFNFGSRGPCLYHYPTACVPHIHKLLIMSYYASLTPILQHTGFVASCSIAFHLHVNLCLFLCHMT